MKVNFSRYFSAVISKVLFPVVSVFSLAFSGAGFSGCSGADLARPHTYAYKVSAQTLFDLKSGQSISLDSMGEHLGRNRVIFLGEQHVSPSAHAFQARAIAALVAQGKKPLIALEMFPPSANGTLDAWRKGKLTEAAFLEKTGWYKSWVFPWVLYRDIFLLIKKNNLPLVGINAEKNTRTLVSQGKMADLSSDLEKELKGLEAPLEPHANYLGDMLGAGAHKVDPKSPMFNRFRRVQRMWDRLMGKRAVDWAEKTGGPVVVLIGSGHLAYGLGANLEARRHGAFPVLAVASWELEKGKKSEYLPLGFADWVWVHPEEKGGGPSLAGHRFKAHPKGLEVMKIPFGKTNQVGLKKGDVITAMDGRFLKKPVPLFMAYERLKPDTFVNFTLLRSGQSLPLKVQVRDFKWQ